MAAEMIAHCGLICTQCEAYLATRTMDIEEAAAVVAACATREAVRAK